ncbi:MAG: hypothetical protein ACFFEV_00025 [Candidatus Thorarchaeota archaeon]
MKRINHKMSRIDYMKCPYCGESLVVSNQCPSCEGNIELSWWKMKTQAAAIKAYEAAERVSCEKCGNEVLLVPDNFSFRSSQFICPDCEVAVLDVTCSRCWSYHDDNQGFYECDGFNPEEQKFRLFSADEVLPSTEISRFVDNLGKRCKLETPWDVSQTKVSFFKGSQVGVLVSFREEEPSEPVGYVTISLKPERNDSLETKGCASPYMIADLFVIPKERGKKLSRELLLELWERFPELIVDNQFNYNSPATDSGMAALRSSFPEFNEFPV